MSCIKFACFALLVMSPLIKSYRILDVQSDDAAYVIDDAVEVKNVVVLTEDPTPSKKEVLLEKVEDLEAMNVKLKQELMMAKKQLLNTKESAPNKVANVQIEKKRPNQQNFNKNENWDVDFWSVLWGIAKHVAKSFLGWFGIRF